MTLLQLDGIVRRLPDGQGSIAILDGVSLDIDPGDLLGVWGERRSGKSTLLRVAAGVERPDAGRVLFDGIDIWSRDGEHGAKARRHGGVALLTCDWRPDGNTPVVEHVALPLLSDGLCMREASEPARRALTRTGVAAVADLRAGQLSQPERVRVALARILARKPRVLLADEPGALLRSDDEAEFYALLRDLAQEDGIALVLASDQLGPLRGASRRMSIGSGRLNGQRPGGELIDFPARASGRPVS
jgi:predicted ABC-type transport system involved in lysophospholipase L1 biosynthesis ATPase subunit